MRKLIYKAWLAIFSQFEPVDKIDKIGNDHIS